MKKYQCFIDVENDECDIIAVDSLTIQAFNPDDAYLLATEIAQKRYKNFYVWEITNDDLIEEL